jgi:hypothetical protein
MEGKRVEKNPSILFFSTLLNKHLNLADTCHLFPDS